MFNKSSGGSICGPLAVADANPSIELPESRRSREAGFGQTPDLYVPIVAILKAAVENPYQRLARGTSGYRTNASNCWVSLWVTQKVPLR